MADSRTTKQNYQDIADAIRSVNGESTQYTPVEMAPKIQALQKKNGDQIIDHYDLTLLYETDTIEMPTRSDIDDDNRANITENIDISDKYIPNIYNNFILWYDLKNIEEYIEFEKLYVYSFYQKNDIINSQWIYNGNNINSIYINNTIVFNNDSIIIRDGQSSTIEIEDENNVSNGISSIFAFSITIDSISYLDNILTSINLNKGLIELSGNKEVDADFINPITRLAIYGATPVYK